MASDFASANAGRDIVKPSTQLTRLARFAGNATVNSGPSENVKRTANGRKRTPTDLNPCGPAREKRQWVTMKRYYPESDGGDTWVGHYWSRQPKTHYVVDELGERIECGSRHEAKKLADRLNRQWESGIVRPRV